ncbi:acetate--CoA ligase family protein [Fodinicola feengrottensis]|uniref:acetate--CoA ligase family protein n=1 Tax=Fodinicola feengrottensis TaxID=435914 RepID=UPI0024435CB0|nr:acetate--CoA ligase family protein [Fodinicola feengrottensis]
MAENFDRAAVQAVLDEAAGQGRDSLTALEGKKVCDAYGIPTPAEALATSEIEAVAYAEKIGFPVVLKIVSPDILHKKPRQVAYW